MKATYPNFVEFTCPFCGRFARVEAKSPDDDAFVAHAIPMCSTFERLDAVAYMKEVNRVLAASS